MLSIVSEHSGTPNVWQALLAKMNNTASILRSPLDEKQDFGSEVRDFSYL